MFSTRPRTRAGLLLAAAVASTSSLVLTPSARTPQTTAFPPHSPSTPLTCTTAMADRTTVGTLNVPAIAIGTIGWTKEDDVELRRTVGAAVGQV